MRHAEELDLESAEGGTESLASLARISTRLLECLQQRLDRVAVRDDELAFALAAGWPGNARR